MYYGWRIVGGTFIAQLFVVGFYSYAISLLTPHLQAEFDVSLEQVMYGMTIGTLAGLVLSPVAGALVDRLSVRLLMAVGSGLFGGGILLMARSETIIQYVWVFGITMALANCFANTIPSLAVVSRWFAANRGRALGVAAIGTSVGGVLLPALVEYWLARAGWRGTLDYLALSIFCIMLPATALLIRNRPSDVGLPDPGDNEATENAGVEFGGARDILASFRFWCLGLSLGVTFAAYSGVLANLAPYTLSSGLPEGAASSLILAVAVSGLIGKLVFGAVADRFNLKHALWVAQLLAFSAYILFSQEGGYAMVLAAGVCMGLAAGGLLPVWGSLLAKIFGLERYGMAMGLMSPVVTLCVMPTFVVIGRLVDSTGSFEQPLLLCSAATAVAAAGLLFLRVESPVHSA